MQPLLDIYLRPGTLSLLAGSGESMHELLLYQIARDMRRGKFLSLEAPSPLSIVLADLTSPDPESSLRLLRELDIDENPPPLWNLPRGKLAKRPIEALFVAAETLWAPAIGNRILFLRGLHVLYPQNPNLHHEVSAVVASLQSYAAAQKCAVLASCSVAKTSIRQEYRPRDRVYGSSAWSDIVEDIFILDFPDASTATDQRRIYLTKSGARSRIHNLAYSDEEGFAPTTAITQDTILSKLAFLATSLPPNKPMRRRDLQRALDPDFPVSDASWKRFLNHAVTTGTLAKSGRGEYTRYQETIQ